MKDRREGEIDGWIKAKESNPGSMSGVWATKNTRAAIWDAMAARESFVTSGTRIKVRFFAGADLPGQPTDPRAMVEQGYKSGVPMGGTISGAAKSPTFTVWASKDPAGANLDRIQIIKGWVNAKGEPQDKVIDVVWSGERKPAKNGKLPAVGNTVDLQKATYTNAIGSPELMGSWTDPAFDAEAARDLLRARARDSDAALHHLRRGAQQAAAAEGRARDAAGTRLDLADLGHTPMKNAHMEGLP